MKKEEEKSYAGLYLFLSFILTLTMAWAVWNEAVGKRPWKSYQSRFHELEKEKVREEYGEAMAAFNQPDVQEKKNLRRHGAGLIHQPFSRDTGKHSGS